MSLRTAYILQSRSTTSPMPSAGMPIDVVQKTQTPGMMKNISASPPDLRPLIYHGAAMIFYRSGPLREWVRVTNPDGPAMVRVRDGLCVLELHSAAVTFDRPADF